MEIEQAEQAATQALTVPDVAGRDLGEPARVEAARDAVLVAGGRIAVVSEYIPNTPVLSPLELRRVDL
jgi:hypothetical protein